MDSDLIVKKPDELVKMRGEFSESALKLSTYLISILKENTYTYNISVRNYLEKFDKTLGDFNKLYYTALELTRKQFKMVDRVKKRFAIYNFFSRAKYEDGILTIKIDDEFHQYLMLIKNNYLRYQIKNIMLLNSKYAIRLYEMLKNKYEKTKKFQKDIYLKMKVEELRKLLAVPLSYKYNMFKRRVLEKAQEEINEKTDIVFDYEEKKKGRKVDEIIFSIKSKYPVKKNRENKQIDNNFKSFRQKIIKEAQGKIIVYNDITFTLKDNLLLKDDKILSKEEAWDWWHIFYKNRDKLKILDKEEIKKMENEKVNKLKKIYQKIKELKEKYKYVVINFKGEDVEAHLSDIQYENNEYKVFISIDSQTLIKTFDDLSKLENFLKVCNNAYKKAKNKAL